MLDIKLPDMDGTELITKLHKANPQMIKIIITGFPSFDNAVKSLNLGADAYITKPVNSKELLELVGGRTKRAASGESNRRGPGFDLGRRQDSPN